MDAARGYAAGVGSATPAAAAGGADLKKQAEKDAKDVGDTWAKSGKGWYDTAKDALKKQIADPAAALIKTEIPGQWNKAIPAWYTANPATLAKQVTAPAATLIKTTVPGQWNATIPKWYDASPAALAKAVAAPAATLIKTTIPGQFNTTIPHWYDSHAATFQSKVIGPQTTWFKSTLPGAVASGMTQAIANIVTPVNSVTSKVNTTVLAPVAKAAGIQALKIPPIKMARGGVVPGLRSRELTRSAIMASPAARASWFPKRSRESAEKRQSMPQQEVRRVSRRGKETGGDGQR